MLGLRVCFISSNLTANKLFPINPRAVTGPPTMSLLLEIESTSALIIEPSLILVLVRVSLNNYYYKQMIKLFVIILAEILFIIIIKKGQQCNAGRPFFVIVGLVL